MQDRWKNLSLNPVPWSLGLLNWVEGNTPDGMDILKPCRKSVPLEWTVFEEAVCAHGMKFKHHRSTVRCRSPCHPCLPATQFPSPETTTYYVYTSIYVHIHTLFCCTKSSVLYIIFYTLFFTAKSQFLRYFYISTPRNAYFFYFFLLTFYFEVILESGYVTKIVQRDPIYPSPHFPQWWYPIRLYVV